jgi:ferredoxin
MSKQKTFLVAIPIDKIMYCIGEHSCNVTGKQLTVDDVTQKMIKAAKKSIQENIEELFNDDSVIEDIMDSCPRNWIHTEDGVVEVQLEEEGYDMIPLAKLLAAGYKYDPDKYQWKDKDGYLPFNKDLDRPK